MFAQTKIRRLEEKVKTQQMLEERVEDLREEVEARKQHEQGLRRELQVGRCTFQIVSLCVTVRM